MGSVLCKLFYTIFLSHKSGIVNTGFRFVSFVFFIVKYRNSLDLPCLDLPFPDSPYTPIYRTIFLLQNEH